MIMKQNNHTDMKEDGDNLLSHLAARQRGTRNSKISFEIFKKVFLGRQLKQVKRRFIAKTERTESVTSNVSGSKAI